MSDNDRLRLISNSGPTQSWVTALPLGFKNWNLSSTEWLISARRRLGLAVRTQKTRCSNCRFHEIGLNGDHALRCAGKMGSKMRHDAVKLVVARAFKQAGFEVKMEQSGGLLDKRRPGDVEVKDWVVINNWENSRSLSIDVAIIDPTGNSHAAILRRDGVGAAAPRYQMRKVKKYEDVEGMFLPFVLEVQGGFGQEAKRLVRELERRRKERECVPNTRGFDGTQQLGEINLVTAIGFELARRNARMILDRSPQEQPLIPSERTKIRMEMRSKKGKDKFWSNFQSPYGCNTVSDTQRLEGQPFGKKVLSKSDTSSLDGGQRKHESRNISKSPTESIDSKAQGSEVGPGSIVDRATAEQSND